MTAKSKAAASKDRASATIGFEAKLWLVESHGGKLSDISIYSQDSRSAAETDEVKWARRKRSFGPAARARRVRLGVQPKQRNAPTRRLAVMNLAIRGIEADFGEKHADTLRRDLHPDLRADFVIANPPFNDSDWFRNDDDVRWSRSKAETASHFLSTYRRNIGVSPKGNANFAWVQHFIHHLAPTGMAGFVLANGSMSSNQSGEGEIRKALIEADPELDRTKKVKGTRFIGMIHHHPVPVVVPNWYTRPFYEKWIGGAFEKTDSLEDGEEFLAFVESRQLGCVIHGHKHIPHIGQSKSGVPIYGCGSSVGKVDTFDKRPYMSVNLVSYNLDSNRLCARLLAEREAGGGLIEDRRTEILTIPPPPQRIR